MVVQASGVGEEKFAVDVDEEGKNREGEEAEAILRRA
jgi:hypothetical protein